ncbi:ABC-type transport auxiliary lipoprotein family protein [Piscinibacter defluvii]|uniref:ABC-type transport auxiliary lipoprotein family protein n=1 Tax=Piscinibacter defluvii TaxID=1796922 RepID=UPI0013E28DF1|nr:ABC-type transport auxiliary lipoprotein family protein [Piscinibacter defluvii]
MRRALLLGGLGALAGLGGCVSVGIGNEAALDTQFALRDAGAGAAPARRAQTVVPALVIQAVPADALGDTTAIAYSRRPGEYAFYQLASWTERPVRALPRLLQRRLEASGLAGAVGLAGEPLRSDWLLQLGVDAVVHDLASEPGAGRIALTLELFDRRSRTRVARRSFEASVPAQRADSAAAVAALSQALAQVFDAALPWLEAELQRPAVAVR